MASHPGGEVMAFPMKLHPAYCIMGVGIEQGCGPMSHEHPSRPGWLPCIWGFSFHLYIIGYYSHSLFKPTLQEHAKPCTIMLISCIETTQWLQTSAQHEPCCTAIVAKITGQSCGALEYMHCLASLLWPNLPSQEGTGKGAGLGAIIMTIWWASCSIHPMTPQEGSRGLQQPHTPGSRGKLR